MWSKFRSLSAIKQGLIIFGSLVAIGAAGGASDNKTSLGVNTGTSAKQQSKTQLTEVKAANIEVKNETETQPVPFQNVDQSDSSLASGASKVSVSGVNGVETVVYKVTYTNGAESNREKISDQVTAQPINQVTKIGTYVAPKSNCDPNYSGGCVPIASDVDCGGGSGNGPAYFYGTATVVGYDIYGLDRDNDGLACE